MKSFGFGADSDPAFTADGKNMLSDENKQPPRRLERRTGAGRRTKGLEGNVPRSLPHDVGCGMGSKPVLAAAEAPEEPVLLAKVLTYLDDRFRAAGPPAGAFGGPPSALRKRIVQTA